MPSNVFPPPPVGKVRWPWTAAAEKMPATRPDGSSWPVISIITPSFNQGQFLEETIRSLLLQGYPQLEYIVIDGGSTDNSMEIIHRYEDRLAHWVSERDDGQSDAVNKGFERATGDIITFCNSDDIYLPGTLADVAEAFIKNPECGGIVGGFRFMDEKGQFTSDTLMPKLDVKTPYDLSLGPPGVYRLHQAATFYTAKALEAVGRNVRSNTKYVLDRELLYRVTRRFPIVTREKTYAAFRLHKQSKSVSQILPFAEEFALLYEANLTGHPDEDRRRLRMARHHRAKGFLKYAKSTSSQWAGALALGKVLLYQPGYIKKKGYYARWLHLLRRR